VAVDHRPKTLQLLQLRSRERLTRCPAGIPQPMRWPRTYTALLNDIGQGTANSPCFLQAFIRHYCLVAIIKAPKCFYVRFVSKPPSSSA
jgi:hypothetical protein